MNFIWRRILTYIVVFVVVINFDFIIPRIAPGNAAETLSAGFTSPQLEKALLEQRFGLNQPVIVQYYHYLAGIFGKFPPDFGFSYQYYPTPVMTLIGTHIGWTLGLIFVSLALAFVIAYSLTIVTALRRGGKGETSATISSILLQATPVYFSGLILLWVLSVTFNWFPIFGKFGIGTSGTAYVISVIRHGTLPVITLTGGILGQYYLLMRGSVQETLRSDFVSAAALRGLSELRVSTRYVMRNALIPVVSVISFSLATLVSLTVLVEAVFGYAGLGDLVVDAALNRDYPTLEGTLFVITLLIIAGGLIGDIILTRLDPRLRS